MENGSTSRLRCSWEVCAVLKSATENGSLSLSIDLDTKSFYDSNRDWKNYAKFFIHNSFNWAAKRSIKSKRKISSRHQIKLLALRSFNRTLWNRFIIFRKKTFSAWNLRTQKWPVSLLWRSLKAFNLSERLRLCNSRPMSKMSWLSFEYCFHNSVIRLSFCGVGFLEI